MHSPLNTKQVLYSVSLLETMSTNIFLWQSLATTCKQIVSSLFIYFFKFNSKYKPPFQIILNYLRAGGDKIHIKYSTVLVLYQEQFFCNPCERQVRNHISFILFLFFAFCQHINKEKKVNQLWIENTFRIKHRFSDYG